MIDEQQYYKSPPKTLQEQEHERLCRVIYQQVPEWLNHKGKPCGCGKGTDIVNECNLGSDGYAWMVQCKRCKSRWVNFIEG